MDAGRWNSFELPGDGREVVPDRLPHDPAISDLEKPEHAVADPSAVAVDVEGVAGQPTVPGMLVEDEVLAVQPSNGNVALVDRRGQELLVTAPDCGEAVHGAVRGADDVGHDRVSHRGEDRLAA